MIAPKPRGGKRPGAGRKRDPAGSSDAGELRRCQVMLDAATIAAHTALGDGNLSLGIRRAARS